MRCIRSWVIHHSMPCQARLCIRIMACHRRKQPRWPLLLHRDKLIILFTTISFRPTSPKILAPPREWGSYLLRRSAIRARLRPCPDSEMVLFYRLKRHQEQHCLGVE